MITAQELRIGNLVNFQNEIFEIGAISVIPQNDIKYTVYSIKIKDLTYLCVGEKDIYPIPLTEQWLLDFGLSKENGYPYKFNMGYLKNENGVFFFRYYDIDIELLFVHQLQNLIFALTGEELTFKK